MTLFCCELNLVKVIGIGPIAVIATATKRRNAGGVAWAEQLLSEVYSLWFLLLPAFIASLQQHSGGENNGDGACLEARHFLFLVVGVFLRLWDSPLQPVDQVRYTSLCMLKHPTSY